MKKIGAGLQFNVYDLGNGKVLKKFRKRFEMYIIYLFWDPRYLFMPRKLKKRILFAEKERKNAINFFSKNKFNKEEFANLEISSNRILQDKVIPLKKVLNKDFDKDKQTIDRLAELIISFWKQGFSDRVYNFTVNNGMAKNRNVVLIDFGEMRFNKEDVKKDILSENWKKCACYKRRIKGKSKEYYRKKMEEILTLENLNKYWETK